MTETLRTILLITVFLVALGSPVWADDQTMTIIVNGRVLTPDVPAQIIDGRTMVPLRFVSQATGAQVGWDAVNQTAIVRHAAPSGTVSDINTTAVADGTTNLKLEIDGQRVAGVPLANVNGRVLVPLRAISEAFGGQVDWNDQNRTATINLISITINGQWAKPDVPARLINNQTMVPLRFVSQALGAEVGWDGSTNTAIVRKNYTTSLPINTPRQSVAGGQLKLEVNGKIVQGAAMVNLDGKVFVPLRLVGQALWADVDWNDQANAVSIQSRPEAKGVVIEAIQELRKAPVLLNGTGKISSTVNQTGIEINNTIAGVDVPPDQYDLRLTQTVKTPNGDESTVDELFVQGDDFYTRSNGELWAKNQTASFVQYAAQTHLEFYLTSVQDGSLSLYGDADVDQDGKHFSVVRGEAADGSGVFTATFMIDTQTGKLAQLHTDIVGSGDYQGTTFPVFMVMDLTYHNGGDYTLPIITPGQIAPAAPVNQ